ncbi:MAG TPA: hypothetical protein PKD99_11205 [Sphingopyxis sp.]|nr:hypothetical protein [Sphingopyxis sp.]HMP45664.1 hypothetical protein [Sphingopyxis sp.]HMQ17908.1 hypothetical protein [Sphingopyxis sp.]
MSRFAAQTLELAIAHFPGALLAPDGAAALRGAAPWLAPGRQLYFECRLAGADRPLDISQHFFAHDGGADALLALAERLADAEGEAQTTWRRIADFARIWSSDAGLADTLVEIGLEHDLGADGWVPAPAVFAAFRSDVLADRAAGERFIAAVAPQGDAAWRQLLATLERAEAHGLKSGRLVGAMLSRDAQLRCMIRGLSPAPVRAFLTDIGWDGDIGALVALLAQPPLTGDATRLVLGFAPALVADCGLEIIHGYDAPGIAARDGLLDWLAARGLADPARVAALREWPAAITPADARADWPDAMIVRDLAGKAVRPHFSGFVNHVKLNLPAHRPALPAKAYLALAPLSGRQAAHV